MKKVEALSNICNTGKLAFNPKTQEAFWCDGSDMVRSVYLPNERQWTNIQNDDWVGDEIINMDWAQEGWFVTDQEFEELEDIWKN
jgi:hypothetical protein